MNADRAIAAVAAAQHGAFSAVQARRAGFTAAAIRHRRESGLWLVAHRGVYVAAGSPRTRERDIMAAVLACGRHAAASSVTAAVLWELIEDRRPVIHVIVPSSQRRAHRGVELHRASLARTDVRPVRSIPTTAPNRTLVDLAAVLTSDRLEEALDTAVHKGLTSLRSLHRYILDRQLDRRPGAGTLRRMMDERANGMSQSELERAFYRNLRASGLPLPTRQFPVGNRYIDVSYPEHRLIVELDGNSSRFTAVALRRDRRRQNEVVLALPGWTLLRFTWDDVTKDWPHVETTLRTALAQV